MEVGLYGIDYTANRASLVKAIADVVHADDFYRYPDYDKRSINFKVKIL